MGNGDLPALEKTEEQRPAIGYLSILFHARMVVPLIFASNIVPRHFNRELSSERKGTADRLPLRVHLSDSPFKRQSNSIIAHEETRNYNCE